MEIGQRIYGAYGGYLGLTEDKNGSKNAKIGLKSPFYVAFWGSFPQKQEYMAQ